MELDGNEKVKALAEGLYPSIREKLSTNGHLVALPLSGYSWSVGFNEGALAKLGMTLADVPDNWSGFLDFLAGLEGKLTKESGIHLLYNGYTDSDVRYELMNMILSDYQYYVNATNPDMGYDTPLVHELLEKLEKIDFVALGCPSDMDDTMFNLDAYDEESVLIRAEELRRRGLYGEAEGLFEDLIRRGGDGGNVLKVSEMVFGYTEPKYGRFRRFKVKYNADSDSVTVDLK